MKEIADIVKAYDASLRNGQQAALVTVVKVEGSSYRRPGARMLVTDDGNLTGAISGGCLEGDALRKALLVMQRKEPLLVTYDTSDEEDAKIGVQLGCNGIIHILIEPIKEEDPLNPVVLLKGVIDKRQNAVVVTFFSHKDPKSRQAGTRLMLDDGIVLHALNGNEQITALIATDARQALSGKKSLYKEYVIDGNCVAFMEFIEPAISLIVFGAGNDVVPLVELADILGWETTVIDGRPHYATAARFPAAKHVVVAKPSELASLIKYDERTIVLLMTHNYNYDLAILEQVLCQGLSYIGLLGPAKKRDRLVSELTDKGMRPADQELQCIYGPTGLDIGAETSAEIALSIVAEVQAVLTSKGGGSLRRRKMPIHAQKNASL